MREITVFILSIIFLAACNNVKVKPQEDIYFSISPYIDQLSTELDAKDAALHKSALLNGTSDTSLIRVLDWERELSIFKEAEINKSAYKGKIEIDSSFNDSDSGKLEITYRTTDKDIRTKLLQIGYNKAKSIEYIKIRLASKNTLYESIQHLELYPDKGFSVQGYQSIIKFREDTFSLQGKFVFE